MRTKGGKVTRRRHKKILKSTKGYRLTKSKLYRVAHEAYMHAGQYSLNDRRRRTSQMKRLWVTRINAAAGQHDMKYKDFIHGLKQNKIELDRKMLADIALNNPEAFSKIVETVK
jgi:large subunit ribosomal protein L20